MVKMILNMRWYEMKNIVNKEKETIYEWAVGKSRAEIENQIEQLQIAIDGCQMIFIPGFTEEMKKHIIESNEEAIKYLMLCLIGNEIKNMGV